MVLPGSTASFTNASRLAADPSGISRFRGAPIRLVDLDPPDQPIATRPNHRPPQLVQPRPRGRVAAQPQQALRVHGAHPRLRRGDPPHRPKPGRQGRARVLEESTGRDRRLVAAGGTVPQPAGPHRPGFRVLAPRTPEALRPPELGEIPPARLVGGELPLEFGQISRILLHGPTHYVLGSHESTKYLNCGISP